MYDFVIIFLSSVISTCIIFYFKFKKETDEARLLSKTVLFSLGSAFVYVVLFALSTLDNTVVVAFVLLGVALFQENVYLPIILKKKVTENDSIMRFFPFILNAFILFFVIFLIR